jgi:hypothetical protein
MNAKEILEKLKMTFNELVNNADAPVVPEVPAPTTTKAKLADGTEVEVTELAVGGIVTIEGVPAPIGEHTLEDGTVITVGDNGAITAIVPVEEAPMVEDMGKMDKKKMGMEEIFSAFETSTNEKFASYEAKFADYEVRLSRATKVIEGLMSLTQVLADTPTGTADPIVTKTNNFKTEETVAKDYRGLFNK